MKEIWTIIKMVITGMGLVLAGLIILVFIPFYLLNRIFWNDSDES